MSTHPLPGSVEDVATDFDITGDAGEVLATLTSPACTVLTLTRDAAGNTGKATTGGSFKN